MIDVKRRILLAAICLILLPASASGAEWWSSYDGNISLEGWGFWKTQLMGMGFKEDSVLAMGDDDWGLQSLNKLRMGSKLYVGDVAISAELETRAIMNEGMMAGGAAGGLMVGFDSTTSARGRLWDPAPVTSENLSWAWDLDRLNVLIPAGAADITIGRQAVSWGSAWFWKVTDRFTPFSPFDIDADVKKGVDGARAEIYFGQTTSLDIVVTVEEDPNSEDWEFARANAGARLRTTLGRFDLAVSGAWFWKEAMAGLEFSGELGKIGFRGEAALNYNWQVEDWDIEAVVGIDWHIPIKMHMALELLYNGYGTDDPDKYIDYSIDWDKLDLSKIDPNDPYDMSNQNLTPDRGQRLARGEAFSMGRYYAGLMINQELHPLASLVFSSIVNFRDPSAMFALGLRWSVSQNVRLTAGAMVPVGKKAEQTDNPMDLKLASEFGDYPIIGYAVLKASF